MEKLYPPYHLHFYHAAYTNFPLCFGPFENLNDAYNFAERFDDEFYDIVRLGYWTSNDKNKYFMLKPICVQRCLF